MKRGPLVFFFELLLWLPLSPWISFCLLEGDSFSMFSNIFVLTAIVVGLYLFNFGLKKSCSDNVIDFVTFAGVMLTATLVAHAVWFFLFWPGVARR